MSVISRLEAMPTRVRLLVSALAERPSGETEERLLGLCSPSSLRRDDVGDPISVFRTTLTTAKDLRLVIEDGGKLRANLNATPKAGSVDTAVFRQIEAALLSTEGLLEGQEDFARATAWFLTQSPRHPLAFATNYKTKLQEQLDPEAAPPFDLTSSDRWNTFTYWLRYLGYGQVIADRAMVPDPTAALRRHLPSAMGGAADLPIGAFLINLASAVVVFEQGRMRRFIEAEAKPGFQREPQRLSKSTSFALLRLEREGLIRLRDPSDADVMFLDLGADPTRRVSHISLVGGQA